MPMGIGLGIGVTRGGGLGWWQSGSALDLYFAESLGFNSIDRTKTTPDSILTYTSPSPKLVYGSDGVLRYAPHNLLLQSQTFETASWTKTNSTITANGLAAPDGTTTADLYTVTIAGTPGLSQIVTVVGLTTYTFTGYVKAGNQTSASVELRFSTGDNAIADAIFSLSGSGSVALTDTGVTASIESVGNGWYRVRVTKTNPGAGLSCIVVISTWTVLAGSAVLGSTLFVWGAQLNAGSSALTYIPTTTAAVYSLPIDHNPTTFAPLGVLIEEQRVNLALYSEDFSNAAYLKSNTTVTANQVAAPDGNLTADLITPTLSDSNIRQAFAPASATAHTLSIWLKSATGSSFDTTLRMTRASPFSNVGNTVITVTTTWQRFSFTATPLDTTLHEFWIGGSSTLSTGENFYAFGYQIEAGAFATSYIPTVASQVTRAADQVSILTSAFAYNAAESTLVVDYRAPLALAQDIVWIADGLAESLGLYTNGSSGVLLWCRDGGVTQVALTIQTMTGVTNKVAAAFKLNDFSGSLNGAAVAVDTVGTMPTPTSLLLAPRSISSANANIHIKRLTYFPTRRSNADLQVLST